MTDLFDRVEQMRQQDAAKEAERIRLAAERAAENRRRMPWVTAAVDQFREVFGDVRVVWAKEGGVEIGSKGPDGIKLSETLVGPWNTGTKKKSEKELTLVTDVI